MPEIKVGLRAEELAGLRLAIKVGPPSLISWPFNRHRPKLCEPGPSRWICCAGLAQL
jgi:hypothetical protein